MRYVLFPFDVPRFDSSWTIRVAHFIMHFWSCFLLPSFQSAIATPIEQDPREIGFTQTGLNPIYREDLSEGFSGKSSSKDLFHSSVRFQKSPWDLQNGT